MMLINNNIRLNNKVSSKINNKKLKVYIVAIIFYLLLFVLQATAEPKDLQPQEFREFELNPKRKIKADIALGKLNRIQINGAQLMEVVGDESKYAVYHSTDWCNLFISPKVSVGEVVEISLVLAGSLVQDIKFTVKDIFAQTIFVNVPIYNKAGSTNIANTGKQAFLSDLLKSEISQMMIAMIDNVKGKYYVIDNARMLMNSKFMKILQLKAYRYKDLSGAVLQVRNSTNKELNLKEEDFSRFFNNVVAVGIENLSLKPKATDKVLVVTRNIE